MTAVEVNFDGLPGPTHNFAGLARGNLASRDWAGTRSWPRRAALQSIEKMRAMLDLGLVQGVLPPHPRPALGFLRDIGFAGEEGAVIKRLADTSPELLAAVYSSSAMWTANAATVSPAADSGDGRIHFSSANLASQLHRAIEAGYTASLLRAIFPDEARFAHHAPLPCALGDEGAANHTRLCRRYGDAGVSLFVYGRSALHPEAQQPILPARQVREASEAVARRHGLARDRVILARQLPRAIDAGVFHNDVIAVGNRNLLLVHETAFEDQENVLARLDDALGGALDALVVPADTISLDRAVSSYLFNSQLVTPPADGEAQALIAPIECREDGVVREFLESLEASRKLARVHFLDVRQSMRNGGGPACLRLRVVMAPADIGRVTGNVIVGERTLDALERLVETRYPEFIDPPDLADPALVIESRTTLAHIHRVLDLPAPPD